MEIKDIVERLRKKEAELDELLHETKVKAANDLRARQDEIKKELKKLAEDFENKLEEEKKKYGKVIEADVKKIDAHRDDKKKSLEAESKKNIEQAANFAEKKFLSLDWHIS